MSRTRKLLIVGIVLFAGVGLAWPFRKTTPLSGKTERSEKQSLAAGNSAVTSIEPTKGRAGLGYDSSSPGRQVAAKMASTGDPPITPTREPGHLSSGASFDLANHPAKRTTLAENARKFVLMQYSAESMAGKYTALYTSLSSQETVSTAIQDDVAS